MTGRGVALVPLSNSFTPTHLFSAGPSRYAVPDIYRVVRGRAVDELLRLFDPSFLLTNAGRTETIGGEEYVVAEAIILREGILNGSDGPLYYPQPEISKRVGIWNGYPIVAPHPYIWVNGEMKHVSANHSPKIAEQFTVGTVYNDRMGTHDGKPVRKVDLYFNVEKANRVDGRIVPAVRAGEPINVSTGIFTEKRKAVENSSWNGRAYTHSVHNIGPDHLAVLMDEKGACSVADGCGINLNAENLRTWTREEILTVALYNRDWPKSKREALSKSAPEDFAGPHQSFPIKTQEDVDSAAKLIGHADDPAAVKAKIKSIAKRKGLSVPKSWESKGTKNSDLTDVPDSSAGMGVTNGGISDLGVFNGSASGTGVYNAWTDAARAASLAARRSSSTAINRDKKLKSGNTIRSHADKAVSHHTAGEFKKAHSMHGAAIRAHKIAGAAAKRRGDHSAASAHADAVAAHQFAQSHYAKRVTHNAAYPKVCPECGGPVDQSTGICSECGYKTEPVTNKGTEMDKSELVTWLTTNCACWKEPQSETVLSGLSLNQLKKLRENALKSAFTDVATGIVRKVGDRLGFDPKHVEGGYNNLPQFVANAVKGKKTKVADDDADDDDDVDMNSSVTGIPQDAFDQSTGFTEGTGLEDFKPIGTTGTRSNGGTRTAAGRLTQGGVQLPESGQLGVQNAVKQVFQNMTEAEWKEWAPPGVREVFNTAEKINTEKKVAIINALTSRIGDPEQRKTEILNLRNKSLPQLEELAKYAGVGGGQQTVTANGGETEDERFLRLYFNMGKAKPADGTNGTTTTNTAGDDGRVRIGNLVMNTKDVLVPHLNPDDYE